MTTLDDVERTLDPEDVVIADDSGVISLAAVMGGATTEVGTATTDILLEGATWDPLAVFKTARRHKLPSEASKRFERIVDPAIPLAAVDRAAALLVEIAGGRIEPVLTDVGEVAPRAAIRLDIDLPDRVAGVTYPNGTAARRLTQVGCNVEVGVSEGDTASWSRRRRRGVRTWCSPRTSSRKFFASKVSSRFRRCSPPLRPDAD
ncbi:hypothetical protein GCM10020255_084470 [Rhodococcus baikonurensis]